MDESAYFDDDPDEDLADWRDVRKAKAMLEAMAASELDQEDGKEGGGEPTAEDDDGTDDKA